MTEKVSESLHTTPENLKEALEKAPEVMELWNTLTPLARNEYICWITSAKKEETRDKRMKIAFEQLLEGKRRPCCWPGCPHRNPNAKKWFK